MYARTISSKCLARCHHIVTVEGEGGHYATGEGRSKVEAIRDAVAKLKRIQKEREKQP
jgi:hypothetical protein